MIKNLLDIDELDKSSKIIVLYSGGLDSTYLLLKLIKHYKFNDVVAIFINLGGLDENAKSIQKISDLMNINFLYLNKESEFANEYVIPALKAKSIYLNQHPISASLSRPFLAKIATDIATEKNYNVILHCATKSQNSLRRFNGAIKNLNFSGHYGSPFELSAVSRKNKIKYLNDYGIMYKDNRKFSVDANFWCREFESGSVDNIENLKVDESMFYFSCVKDSSLEATKVKIRFTKGIPTALNGKNLDFSCLVNKLNYLVGQYGLGRYIGLEELESGVKFPEVREMPAATLLIDALAKLELAIFSASTIREKMHLEQVWINEAVEGCWGSHLQKASFAFIDTIAREISGEIEYKLSINTKLEICSLLVNNPSYKTDRENYEKETLANYKNQFRHINLLN